MVEHWETLKNNAGMVYLEVKCMREIYSDFEKLVTEKNQIDFKKIQLEEEYRHLETSGVESVGFFKKITKNEKLN